MKITGISDTIDDFDGVIILTDDPDYVIKFLIDDSNQCCEQSGFISTEDDLEDFKGAEILSVTAVDSNGTVAEIKQMDISLDSCLFLNVETDKGTLQFAIYNEHNGYYSHDVIVQIGNRKEEYCL